MRKEKSVKMRRMYPMMIIGEFVLVPSVLGVFGICKCSLYIVLVFEIIVTIYAIVVPLYAKKIENIRNYIHRGIILSITTFQLIIFQTKPSKSEPLHPTTTPSNSFFPYSSLVSSPPALSSS